MKYLVIVESPVKIKKLKAVLPSNYEVISTYGHLMDLDPNMMAIDFENNYEPTYMLCENMTKNGTAESRKRKKENTNMIKKLYKKCDRVVIASDLDREGEFIAESIKILLKLKSYDRIVFAEISKKAIMNAIANPIEINYNKIHAQQTRRFMDRMFGYGTTPLLPYVPGLQEFGNIKQLGCGRIQNIITKITIDRENEIDEFFNTDRSVFYKGYGNMELCVNNEFFDLHTSVYETIPKIKLFKYDSNDKMYETIVEIMDSMIDCDWQVTSIKKRTFLKAPKPPHITATLQCAASSQLKWPIKKTMEIAQQLYATGYITYIRTDSTLLSDDALNSSENLIKKTYGELYHNKTQYSTESDSAQEAHEAIRPTDMEQDTENLSEDCEALYELIWKRVMASQMSKAEVESSQIFITPFKDKPGNHIMVGSKSRYIFKGFTILDSTDEDDEKENENDIDDIIIPDICTDITAKSKTVMFKEHVDNPPPRYTESQMVKLAVKMGIGRPATFVPMISKVQEKKYITTENIKGREKKLLELEFKNEKKKKFIIREIKTMIGNEKKRLKPSKLGIVVNEFLSNNFPQIMEINFTSNLEKKLDLIVEGKLDWLSVLNEFNNTLQPQINNYMSLHPTKQISNGIVNDDIVGVYKDSNIYFFKIKKRYVIKCTIDDNDIWVNVLEKPLEEEAYKLIEDRDKNGTPKPKTTVIKTVGKYTIRQGEKNAFIQSGNGSKVIFCTIYNIDPAKITLKQCKELIDKKKKYKKN